VKVCNPPRAWSAGVSGFSSYKGLASITLTEPLVGIRVVGNQPLVTFGIHTSGKRIVNYVSPPSGSR